MQNESFPYALLILSSNTIEGTDISAFNKWYNETHVPDMLTIEEIESARRYLLAPARLLPGVLQDPVYEFYALYRLRAKSEADLVEIARKMHELGSKGISVGPFDHNKTSANFLLAVSDNLEADPDYIPSNVQSAS